MRLVLYITPLLYFISSMVTFETSSASIFLPTPAPVSRPKIPIIKRRKMKKKPKTSRQISSGVALDRLLEELELLPVPEELMQRSPENSIIIRRTKKQRRKKNLQTKDDIIKNVEQIQRDLSSLVTQKQMTTESITTHPKTTTHMSSKSTSISPSISTRVPKSISYREPPTKQLPSRGDSSVQETRTLTKYTPEHHIKPMVFFKQVSPFRISPTTTTTSTPTFPHFPIRNISTPPTIMTREPSSSIQFKKKLTPQPEGANKTENELSHVTEKTISPTSFWIAPTNLHREEKYSMESTLSPQSNFETEANKSPIKIFKSHSTSEDSSKKSFRMHRPKSTYVNSNIRREHIFKPHWNPQSDHRESLKRTRKKIAKNTVSISSLQTTSTAPTTITTTIKSITTPKTQKTTTLPWIPSTPVKVFSKSIESPSNPVSQHWTSNPNPVYRQPLHDPVEYSRSLKHTSERFPFETTKINDDNKHLPSWKTNPTPQTTTTTTFFREVPKIRVGATTFEASKIVKPTLDSLSPRGQSEWIPFSKDDEDRSNNGRQGTKTPIYFTQTIRPVPISDMDNPNVFKSGSSRWKNPDNIELKESFTSWNPPSFQNLESEMYSSSWSKDPLDNDSESSRSRRQRKLDPMWNQTPRPLRIFNYPTTVSAVKKIVREIKNEDHQSFSRQYSRPRPWNHPPPPRIYDRQVDRYPPRHQNNDWDVPSDYKKLLVYDPYTFNGNFDKIPSSSISTNDEDGSSAYFKPGPPYIEDEVTQYVPELVSTTAPPPTSNLRPEELQVSPHRVPKFIHTQPEDLPDFPFHQTKYPNEVFAPQFEDEGRSTYERGIKDSDLVDYGAYSGSHGAFGWYADFPVAIH